MHSKVAVAFIIRRRHSYVLSYHVIIEWVNQTRKIYVFAVFFVSRFICVIFFFLKLSSSALFLCLFLKHLKWRIKTNETIENENIDAPRRRHRGFAKKASSQWIPANYIISGTQFAIFVFVSTFICSLLSSITAKTVCYLNVLLIDTNPNGAVCLFFFFVFSSFFSLIIFLHLSR